jgi:hypothetical protein
MKRTPTFLLVLTCSLVAEVVNADFTFGIPTNLGPILNSPNSDHSARVSADELTLFFSSNRDPGGYRDFDLWVATRQTRNEAWDTPLHMGDALNSRGMEWTPCPSADGRELYFADGPWGNTDILVVRRNGPSDPWGPPESIGQAVNSATWDAAPSISADGLELFFQSDRPGGFGGPDLYVTTRASTAEPWGPAVNLGPTINTGYGDSLYGEWDPSISHDGLTLFFSSARPPGSASNLDIWITKRATRESDWGQPVHLGFPVNGPTRESGACISSDGRTLYFVSARPGGSGGDSDFWQVPIIPVVDLNGDGTVNSADMCIMVDHWQTDDASCDIGPTPLGDGIVDVEDLKILAGCLFEDVSDATLVAHWPLDEVQGVIAYDDAGVCDGTLVGSPIWQPDGGIVAGALQFDGADDYVSTNRVLNPADGPFSALLWVKDGMPGKVIVSQQSSTDWLFLDERGKLATGLGTPGRGNSSLSSETVVTDGQWHRVAFVWNGSQRALYVDSIVVAHDSQDSLQNSLTGLYIGVGNDLAPGTFFSGLIDEIRIYTRVVSP